MPLTRQPLLNLPPWPPVQPEPWSQLPPPDSWTQSSIQQTPASKPPPSQQKLPSSKQQLDTAAIARPAAQTSNKPVVRKATAKPKVAKVELVQKVLDYFADRTELDVLQEAVIRLLPEEVDDDGQPPENLKDCKYLLKHVYVYIYDYVDGKNEDLENKSALLSRCRADPRGFFPRGRAKNGGLQFLLKDFSL